MGNMLAKAQMQIFGDPDTMAKMSVQFMRAASSATPPTACSRRCRQKVRNFSRRSPAE